MALTPITRKEQFYARIAGDEGQVLAPITRTEHFLQRIIEAGGGGGGGSVSSVNGKTGAVVLVPSDIGAATAETVVEISGSTATITPAANTIYNCGELTSLTITEPPATGAWSVVFTSGSTATDCDFPDSLQWQNDTVPTINANKTYEIIVKDNRAVCGEFPVAGVSA